MRNSRSALSSKPSPLRAKCPVVDVQGATLQVTLNRQVLDTLPTGRSIYALAALIPGATSSRPDVGGSEGMQTTCIFVHGSDDRGVTIDGLTTDRQAISTTYVNDGGLEEISYRTSALPAEVQVGGTQVMMVGKQGGNDFHGQLFFSGANSSMQSNNFTEKIRTLGMKLPNRIHNIFDINVSAGGPVKRDRVWFFSSYRRWGTNRLYADTVDERGNQALDDNLIWDAQLRLSWQINQKNKLVAYYDRNKKDRYHRRQGAAQFVADRATYWQQTPINYTASLKWTSTISNKLLLEAGVAPYLLHWKQAYQPGVLPTDIAKLDFVRSTLTGATTQSTVNVQATRTYSGSVSYVTGAHAFKSGLQWREEKGTHVYTFIHDDILLRFRNGVADSVDVYNTPVDAKGHADADVGAFVQDQWTVKRATLNLGSAMTTFSASFRSSRLPTEGMRRQFAIRKLRCRHSTPWRRGLRSRTTSSVTARRPSRSAPASTSRTSLIRSCVSSIR